AIRRVTLHYLVIGPNGKKPERGEPLEKHPDAKKVTLKVEGLLAAGELSLDAAGGELFVQAVPDGGLGGAGMSTARSVELAAAAKAEAKLEPKAEPKIEPKTVPKAEPKVEPRTVPRPTPRPTPGAVAAGRGPRIQGGGANEFRDHAPKDGLLIGL